MEKKMDIWNKIDRKSGMKVPEGYFDNFTSKMMDQLPEQENISLKAPSFWQKIQPWVYMAAMFAGIALMARVFTPQKEIIKTAETEQTAITNENMEDYLFECNVDDYSVYEFLANNQ